MDLSPDEENFQGRLLHQAALWDNVELLQELIATGADVNAIDDNQRSALHGAALAERSQCLVALCASGTYVDAKSNDATGGKTALHISAERGHVENVRALLKAGSSLNIQDANGDVALALAERSGHRHAARALRDARDAQELERLAQHAQLRELLSRGENHQLKAKLQDLGNEAGLIANLTPGGANTLLYVASEAGLTAAVASLLDAGADGRAHPVTKYCPLYIACYHDHREIVKLLLANFPEAVQQPTVEKWLPIHAAAIGGHPQIVTILLEFPYPEHVLNTYTDPSGKWQYAASFDVNAQDASGQTALYIACTLGNAALVDALLSYKTIATFAPSDEPEEPPVPSQPNPQVLSPQRGISLGIHAIVSKLTGGNKQVSTQDHYIRPVNVDISGLKDSCLAAAARNDSTRIARALLACGAQPTALALYPEVPPIERERRGRSRSVSSSRSSPSPCRNSPLNSERGGPWTALAIAARNKNVQLVELLLTHGATDPNNLALRECCRHGLTSLLASMLASKAFPDPDYKINKALVSERVLNSRDGSDVSLTYNALCPTIPVVVNWRQLHTHIPAIKMSWLRLAASRVNPKISSTKSNVLHALTRIDISNNELRVLPPELFTLLSLRYLNAAQNKLERLPELSDPFENEEENRGRKSKKQTKNRPDVYSSPVLQELYLQDNRLEELPPSLFSLPALTTLDVSNNKLRFLPCQMWTAPVLKELNAALNHLRDLPTGEQTQAESCGTPTQIQSPCESSPMSSATPSVASQFSYTSQSKSSSRSPSIERSESESVEDADGLITPTIRSGNAVCSEAKLVHTWRGIITTVEVPSLQSEGSGLTSLNLSHNQFTCIPLPLACKAPRLTSLNMAYNNLRSMSFVTSYPTSLRQLDLSHNEITCWPSLPQVENFGSSSVDPLACYCDGACGISVKRTGRASSGGVRAQLLSAACPARSHLRLESLRTLILANNILTRIQLTTDDDGHVSEAQETSNDEDEDEWNSSTPLKGRLLFPLLSMLDVSCNLLKILPSNIHALTNLSVLNISGNKDITDLPPQMGLLSRLWNLSTGGCSLQEPLRSMMASGRYKSMHIVGYLKSVLQEARPYATMKLMLVGLQGIGKTSLLECLRQESALHHRRKPTDHWAKRMGNKTSRRGNMSTVGVDIGAWVYEKQRSNRGPVTFRTWDFGGQHEYYATHQYFLSRRSLYLVVWKATDGRKGLEGALEWLRSIQARAPGSPCIMVATHYDKVNEAQLPENESPQFLQRIIRTCIMDAADADKLGLPKVVDSLEVSCSTRHNIKLLADIIYSVAFTVKPPGSKEPLLEQRIPATYLALEECVTHLATEMVEPVVRHEEYKRLVTQYLQQKNYRMFRDAMELHQATVFLHENGVLLHYDDANLKELYFLNPQWLCDVLAHVVTVREINPFAANGVMKIEDLAHVFKASPLLSRGDEARSLGVSLLNKFELALCWEHRLLLVPALLHPTQPADKLLPLRTRSARRAWAHAPTHTALLLDRQGTDSPTLIHESMGNITVSGRNGSHPFRRLLLMSYIPCGFWARLITRVLADQSLADCVPSVYNIPSEMDLDETTCKALQLNWGWRLWGRGVGLWCESLPLMTLKEISPVSDSILPSENQGAYRFRVHQEGVWCELDPHSSSCVELLLPAQVCVMKREDGLPIAGYQSISLEPNLEALTKILAMLSDHVDLLLEDWYPALGTRFVHTSEGRCLITRLVPCPLCYRDVTNSAFNGDGDVLHQPIDNQQEVAQAFRRLELAEPMRLRLSEESRTSDGDSGVGAESNASSRVGSAEGIISVRPASALAWSIEECILAACTNQSIKCAKHPDIQLRDVAPDTLLLDVEESFRAKWEHITILNVVGRGAFGTVAAATWKPRGEGPALTVAVKVLQPVDDPLLRSKAAMSRWQRDPLSGGVRAYCSLRQELGVLRALRHPHVVQLKAACSAPRALAVELAPQGSLDSWLRQYRSVGARVSRRAVRAISLQAARALDYLHCKRVLYRDLKSENVLVWAMPKPHEAMAAELRSSPIDVHIKLGDYGISRLAPPSGTKGFGGTEGYMAPEIMRYNGEEEYTEKVDCFSFGMLLYEIITLRQPFEGQESVKEAILDGARPSLTAKDLQYPCNMIELMRRCWLCQATSRPSAGAIASVASAPELASLQRAALAMAATCAAARHASYEDGSDGWEIWFGGGDQDKIHTVQCTEYTITNTYSLVLPADKTNSIRVTSICRVGNKMWVGDSIGRISVYSASTCGLLWTVYLQEHVGGAPSSVTTMLHLPCLRRLALALANGRLFLVEEDRPTAEGSFVLSELGAATELCCLTAVRSSHGMEVWAGGDGLYSYSLNATGVCGADILIRSNKMFEESRADSKKEYSMIAHGKITLLAAVNSGPYMMHYVDPDVSIYQWCVEKKKQRARLDVGKLAPCSESLQSIAIEEHKDRARVTSMCTLGTELYVGTAWGCVIVVDAASLAPLTVFRPCESDMRVMVPLIPRATHGASSGKVIGSRLMTFGTGYRPLVARYAPTLPNQPTYNGHYCLLWRAEHWLPD